MRADQRESWMAGLMGKSWGSWRAGLMGSWKAGLTESWRAGQRVKHLEF